LSLNSALSSPPIFTDSGPRIISFLVENFGLVLFLR
jgi:hypothetical protein